MDIPGGNPVAVQVNGACPAVSTAAAELGAGQIGNVAEVPQQRHFRVAIELLGAVIHFETDHACLPGANLPLLQSPPKFLGFDAVAYQA